MFIHPNWTNNRNFQEDPITKHLRMVSGTLPWQARVYLENSFPAAFVEGGGIRIFHNVNPGEDSIYAMGMSQSDPQSVLDPADLEWGIYFDTTEVFIIAEGAIVGTLPEQNSIYDMRSDATDTVNWYIDGTIVHTVVTPIDYTSPWHFFVLGHTAFKSDLETMVNPDGIDRLLVNDIVFDLDVLDETGGETVVETSVFGNANVPALTQLFRCKMECIVDPTTVSRCSNVLIERLIRPGEDPISHGLPQNATRIPIEAVVPYNWSSNSELHIFIQGLDEGDTLQFTIGTEDQLLYELIQDGTSVARAFEPVVAIFKIEGTRPEEVPEEELGHFFNDIYFKTRHLSSLIDIDDIIYKASDYFDFEYKVTEYDADANTYDHVTDPEREELGLEDTDRVLRFENQKSIEELFVKQYLPEYINYMKDINDPPTVEIAEESTNPCAEDLTEEEITCDNNSPALIIDSGELKDLKNILFKNITLMNYFKGTEVQMEFLISIFSSSLGWHYISVDPDPYHKFIYRISTTMPERYWTENIRPITHPLGWDDMYVFVPRCAINWHQIQILDATQIETYFLRHMERGKPTYIDYADYLDSTATVVVDSTGYHMERHFSGEVKRYGTYTGNALEEDLISEKTFPFNVQEYSADIEYGNKIFIIAQDGTSVASDATDGLFHEVRNEYPVYDATVGYDGTDIGYDISDQDFTKSGDDSLFSATRNGAVWKFEFHKTGLAGYYIWEVYRNNGLIAKHKTHIPKLYHISQDNEELRVILRLKMKNWSLPIFSYEVNSSHRWLKNLKDHAWKVRDTYIDKLAGSKIDRYDGAEFSGVVEDYFRIHDGDYQGNMDETSVAAVATDSTMLIDGTTHTVFFNDGTAYTEENMVGGIFTEFEWTIREGSPTGKIINTIRTSIPVLNYVSPGSRNIGITLIRGDLRYTGPNTTI